MKKIVLALLATSLFSVLTGCASMPEAPKNAEEKIALGEDSFLNVPVDVATFPWEKKKITAQDGSEGQITVFTDPVTGKAYDLDGQPLNEKGFRILKDGYVCEVKSIGLNRRFYTGSGFWSNDDHYSSCVTSGHYNDANKSRAILAGGALLGGAAILGSLVVNSVRVNINDVTKDDTL